MGQLRLDDVRAKMWMDEVNQEITQVDGILKSVRTAMVEVPGEDDPIYKGIGKIVKTVEEVWNKMIGGFKKTSDMLKQRIEDIQKTSEALVQQGDDLNKKLQH